MALVALGGYGRRELCPHSDLDLLLLHQGRPDIDEVATQIWYPVWDERISLDHSVRTVRSAVGTAENDVRTGLTMLDARLVAGDAALLDELRERLARSLGRLARRWLLVLDDMTVTRHHRAGDVAFLLEPDLKDGKGGLRDAAALHAVGSLPGVHHRGRRRRRGARRPAEHPHRAPPGRRAPARHAPAAGAGHGRHGGSVGAGATRSWRPWPPPVVASAGPATTPGPASGRGSRAPVAPAAGAAPGTSATAWCGSTTRSRSATGADGDDDLGLWLHAGAQAAQMGVPFARETLRRMTLADPAPLPDPWPAPARADFLALVGSGNGLVPAFDALDHAGLWTELIPEWTAVRNRPQRNAFHHFTVDRHLIEAAVQAAPLTRSVSRPDVLVVAALLHDIGKGSPGDHTEAGVELVATIAARIGLSPADGRLVQDLVRLHLLLPDTATRRDLDDPKTVALVADEVGSVETLDLLAALTEADARATGPTAWTPWRAGLVAALVERVRRELAGNAGAALLEPPIAAMVDVDPAGGATVVGDGTTATVIAPDRRGLFCAVAGVLALHGLDILGATASSRADGIAVEAFRVQPTVDRSPPWDLVQRDLRAVLDGTLPLDEHLARRRRVYGDEAAGPGGATTRPRRPLPRSRLGHVDRRRRARPGDARRAVPHHPAVRRARARHPPRPGDDGGQPGRRQLLRDRCSQSDGERSRSPPSPGRRHRARPGRPALTDRRHLTTCCLGSAAGRPADART